MEAKNTDFAGVVLLFLVTRPFVIAAWARPMLKTPPHREPMEKLGYQDCAETDPNHARGAIGWVEFNYSGTE
jgi:hypothetical protein